MRNLVLGTFELLWFSEEGQEVEDELRRQSEAAPQKNNPTLLIPNPSNPKP
jgi:hypothetical protein